MPGIPSNDAAQRFASPNTSMAKVTWLLAQPSYPQVD
jgi:hypothetical protein